MAAARSRRASRPGRPGRSVASQPRGALRREALLEAALRIVARDGVAAVTHRAVAAEAGVSHRLTTYYFETKEQMLLEAFRQLSARSLERTERAAKPIAAARDRAAAMEAAIDAVTDAVLGSLRSEIGGAAAEFSLVLEIPRQPALAVDYAAWQRRVEALLREHALALHSDDPEADVRILQAAMRGLQLESLSRPGRPLQRAALRRVVARLLKAL
jgi:DNA-binding transcriptional regulator YbjK